MESMKANETLAEYGERMKGKVARERAEKLKKQPRWVQDYVAELEADNALLTERITQGSDGARIFASPFSTNPQPVHGTEVDLHLNGGRSLFQVRIKNTKADDSGIEVLEIHDRGHYGPQMVITPSSSNVVQIASIERF